MAAINKLTVAFILALSSTLAAKITTLKPIVKREVSLYGDPFSSFGGDLSPLAKYASAYSLGAWQNFAKPSPSPSEVASAIAAAKQASANVMIAQQQMQAAKENVLAQQKIAMDKETTAAILTQKSETAAAIQRSEAASAAQAVVLAQQRLAAAKAAVAHQQRIASAKEAEAAGALQRAAHAAAAEIQRTENEAAKHANIHRTGNAAAQHHLTATKDAAFTPITAGNNHVPSLTIAWPALAGALAPPSSPGHWASSPAIGIPGFYPSSVGKHHLWK